jgi:hypothetical protein
MARALRTTRREGFADGGVQTGEAVRHECSIRELSDEREDAVLHVS